MPAAGKDRTRKTPRANSGASWHYPPWRRFPSLPYRGFPPLKRWAIPGRPRGTKTRDNSPPVYRWAAWARTNRSPPGRKTLAQRFIAGVAGQEGDKSRQGRKKPFDARRSSIPALRETLSDSSVAPAGLATVCGHGFPPLKRWAIPGCPCGTKTRDNSPPIHRWAAWARTNRSPPGRKTLAQRFIAGVAGQEGDKSRQGRKQWFEAR